MRQERELVNTAEGTKATLRLNSELAIKSRGVTLYPLSLHQVRRLRKKLDPRGIGPMLSIGIAGEFPLEQSCGITGYVHRVVERGGGVFLEVRRKVFLAVKRKGSMA